MSSTRSRKRAAAPAARTSRSGGRGSKRSGRRGERAEPDVDDERIEIIPSSGNVFADLGFAPEEAENLLIRAELMRALEGEIQRRGLTQTAAAALLGVRQPRISDLMRRKIGRFTNDSLVNMLARLGVRVRVELGSVAA